jgi:catechol 2,3-dioxygenase-like lactoylglutathione lyase family enzyme
MSDLLEIRKIPMIEEPIAVIPIFRIFSPMKAREFYVDFLGFRVDWEHQFEPKMPLYIQVSRGRMILHLSEHDGDCPPGATVYVRLTGLEAFHAELTAKTHSFLRPGIEVQPWGSKVMEVIDPFGNRIRFAEDLPGQS